MNRPLILLRPQPGNDASAGRARTLGLDVVQFPLFEIVRVDSDDPPDGPFDALLVTSTNGARLGAKILARFPHLTVYVVGEASARSIHDLGERDVQIGGGDAASTIPLIVADGHAHVLHICGEETRDFDAMGLTVTRHIVYRADARDMRPFVKALAMLPPSVIAVHSPRAGRRLNALMPPAYRNHILLAISEAAAVAAGKGWRQTQVAPSPDDSALLRLASTLCMGAS